MSDRKQPPTVHSRRLASLDSSETDRYEREVWMHDFRNALGTIMAAAGAANSLLTNRDEIEISIAIGHIEEGCNRCLRLFRTMPPY